MLGLALLAYLPAALGAGLLDFDDTFYFGPQNPEFRDGVAAILDPSRPIANAWLPVAHLSLWLDWRLGGGAAAWPHVTSLLLHAVAGAVLVRLVQALGARPWLALATAAVFVVHPALAESVAWASGRKDVLSGLFVFTALGLSVSYATRPRPRLLVGLSVLGGLAMYSKATAVVLPLLALLVCCHRGADRRRFLAPLVLLLVTLPIAWHHQTIAAAEGTLAPGAASERLAQVPGAFWHYLATTAWPARLNVLYPEVDTLAQFRADWLPGCVALALAGVAVAMGWRRPGWRLAALGLAAFVVALLPFNTAFPASSIAAADRYLYMAVPGAALAALAALGRLWPRAAPWLAAAVLSPLVVWCGGRAQAFADDETLWRQSLAVESANAVAHLNLVYELLQRGSASVEAVQPHLEAAVAAARYPIHELRARLLLTRLCLLAADYGAAAGHAQAAIAAAEAQLAREIAPKRRAEAEQLLLQACLAAFEPLRLAGDASSAERALQRGQALAPAHPDVVAFEQLRALAHAVGEPPHPLADDDPVGQRADAALAAALQQAPSHAGLWCTQAAWDTARGRLLPALRNYRRAQAADPRSIDAWLGAARLLRGRGNYADAEHYARQGLMHRADPALRQELALALVGQGQLDDAILQLEAYLRLCPTDRGAARVLANVLVGKAYARQSDPGTPPTEVLALVQRALALNPDEAKAHLVLGRLAREQRRFGEAVAHLETAHRLLPDFDEARRLLAEACADLGYERILRRDDDAAGTAFRRCLDVAPDGFDGSGVQLQLAAIWRRSEQRGLEALQRGDRAAAAAAFRRCLELDPQQHWAAWLLASAVHDDPAVDLAELEQLCRLAVAWQQRHGLDASQQVYLLAATLARTGDTAGSRAVAREFLRAAPVGGKPQVLAALRRLADD
ncbi:MAG: glycosyltransferase family 39 protein [Planctomycetes bacterium]|nr:glycosyltransferase family 39 protein [Planctomycetota bacterium]